MAMVMAHGAFLIGNDVSLLVASCLISIDNVDLVAVMLHSLLLGQGQHVVDGFAENILHSLEHLSISLREN